MRTILHTLKDDQAQKEMEKFAKLGLLFSMVGLFVFGWIGGVGIAFGGRALLLTFHKGNKRHPRLWWYRLLAGIAFVLGLFDVVWFFSHN